MELAARRVDEILESFPGARRLLAEARIDTCCGGQRTLAEAAAASGADLAALVGRIAALRPLRRLPVAAPGTPGRGSIQATTTVRDAIRLHPATRAVFERHGLLGCGGAEGPDEPIGFFARAHEVDAGSLLAELEAAARAGDRAEERGGHAPAPPPAPAFPNAAFLKAAIAVLLTFGCAWGALNLVRVASRNGWGTLLAAHNQAHGHAQIFGWVGLFIAGVALHVVPRLKGAPLAYPRLTPVILALWLAGVLLRAALGPFGAIPAFATLVLLSSLLELAAVAMFAASIARTLARAAAGELADAYLQAALAWLVVAAAGEAAMAGWMAARGSALLPVPFGAAVRHVELAGFITLFILGISARVLPLFLGLGRPSSGRLAAAFLLLNGGLLARVAGILLGPGPLLALAGLAELAGAVAFVAALGLFRRGEARADQASLDRRWEKFVRASYAWWLLAAGMLALFSLLGATGREVPAADLGAYRHAVTVGFVTLMVFGVSLRIVPVFTGRALARPWTVGPVFWLLNLGNALRVGGQLLGHRYEGVFLWVAASSGAFEVAASVLYASSLWPTLSAGAPLPAREPAPAEDPHGWLGLTIGEVCERHPQALELLAGLGFGAVRNPPLRRTVGRATTLATGCRLHGIDPHLVVARLDRLLHT